MCNPLSVTQGKSEMLASPPCVSSCCVAESVMAGCLQPGAQYTQKPGLFSPSETQQGGDSKQVDDLGLDLSKQGKRWFPFSDGPRNCVGQALAKMNMAATFAQLYSHYSFKLAEEVTSPTTRVYAASWLLLVA